ncbi:MAG: tRNA uridine-5-carboxymethylaminomethyl(34) synthesis GTPase MnmE [Bacteroidales bacterium]|nr:tRNA uridine-5-carboxymethylaminomethyl(34) synthesis GTPase MnmE [Lachnoclostridium sp.]MCM1384905.1 tRNA uridine-5-carboxymethylaminomethyl(34) synthesis GTPase MnmE [Lachnoclostridium sp.]MCM1465615.1 tRNA uridine-5-carboxymethylaminomethyl(34) synthesis GTPase MnmE [Bacteroidales bacterium]
MKTDTIAAIATALSDSGIGIIRISGREAISVADRIFRNKYGQKKLRSVKSHTIHYGYILDVPKEKDFRDEDSIWKNFIIDEVMVSVMKSPNSYTTEDTVEINCHGGILVMQKILEAVLKSGARMAEPGEFTKRAFLTGRIDLSKAEAVMDVISSQNEFALKSSVNQLKGNLYEKIKSLREEILYEIAFIESALDDPEHISLEGYSEKLLLKVESLLDKIGKLLETAENGKLLREGIATVIVGKPNAGKSSLLNLLVGEERAIVTDVAGTTRDILEEHIQIHGIGLNVIDTAGIRNTNDTVEKIGVDRAKKYAEDADLIVYVVDASVELNENDRDIMSLIYDKNVIILLNKTDLEAVVTEESILEMLEKTEKELSDTEQHSEKEYNIENNHWKNISILRTSTKENTGIDDFENVIKEMFFKGELQNNNEIVITNMRHKEALLSAFESLKMVKKSIDDGMEEDFYSIDLMSAYAELGKIIGEQVEDDLVEEIFSKFCMGK